MASYEPVDAKAVLGIEDGHIVLAAKVLGRMTSFGELRLHVATWEAGQGTREDYLTPAEFSDWRWSFEIPLSKN